MKKHLKVNLVLFGCMAISIIAGIWLRYAFFWGGCCGAAVTLLVFNYAGQRQLKKAIDQVDKSIKDRQIIADFNNLKIDSHAN